MFSESGTVNCEICRYFWLCEDELISVCSPLSLPLNDLLFFCALFCWRFFFVCLVGCGVVLFCFVFVFLVLPCILCLFLFHLLALLSHALFRSLCDVNKINGDLFPSSANPVLVVNGEWCGLRLPIWWQWIAFPISYT